MYDCKTIILLTSLMSLSMGSTWVLTSTHSNVVSKLTNDVSLKCHCENLEDASGKFDQLTRIRLLKQNDTGTWMTLAEISVPNNSSVHLSHTIGSDVVASGHLGTTGDSFLLVTWPTAYVDIVGTYQCEVDGFGDDVRSDVHVSTPTVNISNFVPTTTDLVDIMIKMKEEIQSRIEDSFPEVRYWPTGNYTLLSPASGCPDTPYSTMVRGFAIITTVTKDKPNNSLSSPNHLHPDIFERCDNRNVFHFRFCRNPIPDDQFLLWPKGSYCVNNYDWPRCPPGFKNGYISAYLRSSATIVASEENIMSSIDYSTNYANFVFCCRHDGNPNVPILLPYHKPFYLYRFYGKCQEVKNMDVSEEWIHFDTAGNTDTFTYLKADSELNDVMIRMCYYTKRK